MKKTVKIRFIAAIILTVTAAAAEIAAYNSTDFANWYYHQIIEGTDKNMEFSIENFVQIINNYKLN